MFQLPADRQEGFAPIGRCIYCDADGDLTDEHIIPFGLGGRRILPASSCRSCAAKTGAFEGTVQCSMLGALRMYYAMPTRRRKERPKTLPLKVKLTPDAEWSFIQVDRAAYPFLILFPIVGLPDELTGARPEGSRQAAVTKIWTRIASFRNGWEPHLQALAEELDVAAIEPTGQVLVPEFFRLLAKIAHGFACAKLGYLGFSPSLIPMLRDADTSEALRFVGGQEEQIPAVRSLHEVALVHCTFDPSLVIARVRLFACLEAPAYIVVVGRHLTTYRPPDALAVGA